MKQKCDTCGKEAEEVSRVVIRSNYDKSKALPLYNCPACFKEKKNAQLNKEKKQ